MASHGPQAGVSSVGGKGGFHSETTSWKWSPSPRVYTTSSSLAQGLSLTFLKRILILTDRRRASMTLLNSNCFHKGSSDAAALEKRGFSLSLLVSS